MSPCAARGPAGALSARDSREEAARETFQGLRDRYRRWRASALGSLTERIESDTVLGALGGVSGARLLDVGCGDGTYAMALASEGARVVGADLSREMVRRAHT